MKNDNRYVGLDVHAETIAVAVVETDGEVCFLGTIPNRAETVRRLVKRLGSVNRLRFCYEAGPTGYVLYWQLTGLGAHCDVVAPTLVPVKPGDRVKTDRRDAEKLAVLYRGGHLTPVWVPDRAHEALRDLVRAREAAKSDQLRARHRLQKFLLRHGRRPPQGIKAWTQKHLDWVRREVRFDAAAQEAVLVDHLAEVEHARERIRRLEGTIVSEVGWLSRFRKPRQLMGYSGGVPREDSSGDRVRRGSITKTGNAHLRRIVGEAAWSYRHRPTVRGELLKRQAGLSEEVKAISWRAQHRLYSRYRRLIGKGKAKQQVITAVARELLGFIWAIGVHVEQQHGTATRRAA